MPVRKYVQPNAKVGLKFTAAERELILDDLMCLGDNYAQVIQDTPADQPVQFTLDEWDYLGEYIAAEANHTEDKRLRNKLDAICNKVQKILDAYTDEERPKMIEDAEMSRTLSDRAAQISLCVAKVLIAIERAGIQDEPLLHFWLSPEQRDVLLLVPGVSKALKSKLTGHNESFTVAAVASMAMALAEGLSEGEAPQQTDLFLVVSHLLERLEEGIGGKRTPKKGKRPRGKTVSTVIYQFKITLKGTDPPIWRRIQVKDCTLDKLHEHIQTAMGWTNSHLHQFTIGGVTYGDPELLLEGFEDDPEIVDSLETPVSQIVPEDGKRLRFEYEYDFGDGWKHEILFEGYPQTEKGARYPLCVEGERACPPEDVGGVYGYEEYLEAMADFKHKRHREFSDWNGPFDAEAFDASVATMRMRDGLPNRRDEESM